MKAMECAQSKQISLPKWQTRSLVFDPWFLASGSLTGMRANVSQKGILGYSESVGRIEPRQQRMQLAPKDISCGGSGCDFLARQIVQSSPTKRERPAGPLGVGIKPFHHAECPQDPPAITEVKPCILERVGLGDSMAS
jgi:hypothetical protein